MFVDKKNYLNCTLAIDSPFQTFAVGLLVCCIKTVVESLSQGLFQFNYRGHHES